jgi:hypothetical protein
MKRGSGYLQSQSPLLPIHSTPTKSYFQVPAAATASKYVATLTPSTSSCTDPSDSERSNRSSSSKIGNRAGRVTAVEEDFFNLWPLMSTNAQEPQHLEADKENAHTNRRSHVSFSPLKFRSRHADSALVSTPMHRQLQIHLQHYLRDGSIGVDVSAGTGEKSFFDE